MDPAQSQVSFWRPSEESEDSIQIQGTFWKPTSQFSISRPSSESEETQGWKWKQESESGGSSIWNWKPSSKESESEGSSIWNWKPSSKPSSESKEPNYNTIIKTSCCLHSDEPIEIIERRYRQTIAQQFRYEYPLVRGRKSCGWFHGNDPRISTWVDFNCYDLVWVAVHGIDSICMVTWRKDMYTARVGSFYREYYTKQPTLCSLAEAVFSEVECLPYREDLREKSDGGVDQPFGVVSVIPGTKHVHEESGNEASSAEDDQRKAIDYLMGKFSSGSAFTFDETIQTAISGFEQLCLHELKAEDIWVSVLELKENDTLSLHLEEIKEHLDVIRGVSSGKRAASASSHSGGGTSGDIKSHESGMSFGF